MKIVIVNSPTYEYALGNPKRIGGAERQQWLLARALAGAGWSVTVGVREGLKAGERMDIDGVNFVGMGSGQFLWSCYRFLASERPDWWYWRTADHLLGPIVQIAKLSGVRTIFATAFDTDVDPRRATFRRPKWWFLYAWGLMQTDRIFVQHGGQFAKLAARLQTKAYVVPSFVGEMYLGTIHGERKGYVAWVATLRQPKRADLLIEIARRLPATQFVVCGGTSSFQTSPEYGQKIVAALHALPNVDFLGKVEPKKTQKIIADAAIFLSTSEGEGFPNTFLEAWSSGIPVVSLSIDPDGVIQKKGLGRVAGSLAQAIADIEALMGAPDLREEIGIRARVHVNEAHSETEVIKVFESAIRGVRV